MFVVFDLDGTLANDGHRKHLAEAREWDAYFDACDGDSPIPHVIEVLLSLAEEGHRIEIWSGRGSGPDNSALGKTVQWLQLNGIYRIGKQEDQRGERPGASGGCWITQLLMREHGDHRRDTELKTEWMKTWGKPDLVFDDRDQAVAMWRAAGVPCFQVAPGDF